MRVEANLLPDADREVPGGCRWRVVKHAAQVLVAERLDTAPVLHAEDVFVLLSLLTARVADCSLCKPMDLFVIFLLYIDIYRSNITSQNHVWLYV